MHDTSGVSKVKTIKRERVIAFIVSDILNCIVKKWLSDTILSNYLRMPKYSEAELQNSRFVRNGNEKDRHISCDGLSVAVPSVRTEAVA